MKNRIFNSPWWNFWLIPILMNIILLLVGYQTPGSRIFFIAVCVGIYVGESKRRKKNLF